MRVRPLALLFALIAVGLGVIAVAALRSGALPVGIAAAVIALWMVTLVPRAARRR
jgi:hypothetical protein